MTRDLLNSAILGCCFLSLFAFAEMLYFTFRVRAEVTRKIVHAGTGLLTMLFPVMLANHWLVLLLCALFALILIASLKFNLLKSINAIDRRSIGSISYPVSVYLCYLVYEKFGYEYLFFYLPVLVLAFCDPIAALTGKRWPVGKYNVRSEHKSLLGSGMFFLSAFVLTIVLSVSLGSTMSPVQLLVFAFAVALVSAFTEGVSTKGSDNLTIPFSVLLVMIVFSFLLR